MTIDWIMLAWWAFVLLVVAVATVSVHTTIVEVIDFFDDVRRIRAAVESMVYDEDEEDTGEDGTP